MALLIEKQFSFVSSATDLTGDTFAVVNFKGFERISKPYEFEIRLVSENPEIDIDRMMTEPARFIIHREDGHDVQYHGILQHFEQLHESKGFVFYRALLSPRLWWLSLTHQYRVFLGESVSSILEKMLLGGGMTTSDFDLRLQGDYTEMDYVCQYGESHLDFISRWMEHEGIYYYFEQTDSGEKVVFTDTHTSHTGLPLGKDLVYSPPSGMDNDHRGENIQSFICRQRQLPRKVLLRDYNYEKPSLEISGSAEVDAQGHGEANLYGEHFSTSEEGNRLAAIRAEELLCRKREFFGESTVPLLMPGFIFTMNNHYRSGFNGDYHITEVSHEGSQAGYLTSGIAEVLSEQEKRVFYTNTFIAIPSAAQFRPERKTGKPRIAGTMHARIDAEGSGDFAELDGQGRYKVRLPFDADTGHEAGKASSFVRMMQPYAGSDYGVHFPLHKGTEVLLTFIDGDPDRPVIAGAAPNPETASPVTSGNQTKSIFRDSYGNELVFDSTPGDEHIRLFSPHHSSLLQLGRSIVSESESSGFEWKGGNSCELGAGNKFAAFAGNSAEVKTGLSGSVGFGLNYEAQMAGKHTVLLGYEAGLNIGPEFKCRYGPTIEKSDSDKSSIAAGDNIVSAKQVLNLIGGAKDDSGGTSILSLEANKISMSLGNNKNPDTTKAPQWLKWTLFATPVIGTVLAAILAGIMAPCLEKSDEGERNASVAAVGVVEGIIILANILIMTILSNLGLKDSIKPVSHFDHINDTVDAIVKLDHVEGINLAVSLPCPKLRPKDSSALIAMNIDGSISINSKPSDALYNEITMGVGDISAADDAQDARIVLQKSGVNIDMQSGKANIWMIKNGSIGIENEGATEGGKNIHIKAESEARLESRTGNIVLNASAGSIWAKGSIKHKNLTILA